MPLGLVFQCVLALLGVASWVWRGWRWWRGPLVTAASTPRLIAQRKPSAPALVAALAWVGLLLVSRALSTGGTVSYTADQLPGMAASLALLSGVLVVCLWGIPSERALVVEAVTLRIQVWSGLETWLLCLLPTALLLLVMQPFRTTETQHSLLQLWQPAGGIRVMLWIVLLAVVLAPLCEELLFREVLQGAARGVLPEWCAWLATALVFCAVHGWRDGIPLLPLALLLGHTRRTVPGLLAPVIAHSLFNATNLMLAALAVGTPPH